MRTVLKIAVMVLLLASPLTSRAWAQSPSEWFTVNGVDVNAAAATAVAARDNAIAEGQGRAFATLMERLVTPSQRNLLPKVKGSDYVRDFSVDKERVDGNRYIATLTVRFVPSAIRGLLSNAGIAMQEQPRSAHTLLLVPVWQPAGQTPLVWEGTSPWKPLWKPTTTPDVSVTLAKGSHDDQYLLPTAQAAAGDIPHLQALGAQYQTGEVMAVIATPEDNGNRINITLATTPGTARPFLSMSYPRQEGETPDALMQRVADAVHQSILESYQQTGNGAVAGFGSLGGAELKVPVLINLNGLPDWVKTRSLLSRMAMLQNWEVASLSRDEAALTLNVRGSEEQLLESLKSQGFRVDTTTTPGVWTLTPPVGAMPTTQTMDLVPPPDTTGGMGDSPLPPDLMPPATGTGH